MRYVLLLVALIVTGVASADTKQEVIIDCDNERLNALTCTACNIYHEARSEPIVGQLAVGFVTMNRVDSHLYPDTACDVVWEARRDRNTKKLVAMFSWTRDGRHDKVYNKRKWENALELARIAIVNHADKTLPDVTIGALWYHTEAVSPYWMNSYHRTVQIGSHIFYTAKEDNFLNTLTSSVLSTETIATLINTETLDSK